MLKFVKIIIFMMCIGMISCANTKPSVSQIPNSPTTTRIIPTTLTTSAICAYMRIDGQVFAQQVIDGRSNKQIITDIKNRFDRNPKELALLPGIKHMLIQIEMFKTKTIYFKKPNFAASFGVVAEKMCLADRAKFWAMPVPGVTIKITPKEILI